jgi:hypothetical protein
MKEIHLFDLPEEIRVRIREKFREKIFYLAYKKFRTTKKLAKILKTKPRYIRLGRRGKVNPTIGDLKKLSSFLSSHNVTRLEKNIQSIRLKKGFINNPKLPIKLSNKFGIVAASLLGDGGITSKFCKVFYTNTNENLINSFLKSTRDIFGDVKFRIGKNKGGVSFVEITSIMGKILVHNLKFPRGDKTLLDYEIPTVILESDKKTVQNFLRRIFDDEGYVNKSERTIVLGTAIEKSKMKNKKGPKRLWNIKYLLQMIGIKCSKPFKVRERFHIGRGSPKAIPTTVEDWRIKIYHKKYLRNFLKNVGFEIESKMQDLKEVISSIKREEAPHGEGLTYFLQNAKNLFLETRKPFSRKDLQIRSSRGKSITDYAIKKLEKMKLLKKVRGCKATGKGFLPCLYTITKKGMETYEVKGTIK